MTGAAGALTPGGVTGADGADCAPSPNSFTEATVNVYGVPAFRPVITVLLAVPGVTGTVRTTVGDAFGPVRTRTTKLVTPVLAGSTQFTVARLTPAVAVTAVGAGAAMVRVWSSNRSCSMFRTVSTPSGPVTVRPPPLMGAKVYALRRPRKTAMSLSPAPPLLVISRTIARLPGSTRPAKTACCRVIPVVPA